MCDTTTALKKEERSASPQTGMTLSITPQVASRMLEASRALNDRLDQLLSKDAPAAQPSLSQDVVDKALLEQLRAAAQTCGNDLIASFYQGLQSSGASQQEIQTCLLLFVQASKSTKLKTAFQTLSQQDKTKDEDSNETLTYDGALLLFKSILTSILSCIRFTPSNKLDLSFVRETSNEEPPKKALKDSEHTSPNSVALSPSKEEHGPEHDGQVPCASPSFDSTMMDTTTTKEEEAVSNSDNVLSPETQREIQEIATFASEKLVEYVQKQSCQKQRISYDAFGDWYNSGGFAIVPWLELLDLAKWTSVGPPPQVASNDLPSIPEEHVLSKSPAAAPISSSSHLHSPQALFSSPPSSSSSSPVLISFDFTNSSSEAPQQSTEQPCCIDISEENLVMLRNLVHRTNLSSRSPSEVCQILVRHADSQKVLSKEAFGQCRKELVPSEATSRLTPSELQDFDAYFNNFYSCFEGSEKGKVNVTHVAVAFAFLCAGNKSAKLSIGFELLDEEKSGHLTQLQLEQYLRSYLTMLVGISLLSANPKKSNVSDQRRQDMIAAIDNGAKWTFKHFLKHFADAKDVNTNAITFENFASWYTSGGYKIAPWLELLDLSKLLALLEREHPANHPAVTRSPHAPNVPPLFAPSPRGMSPRRRLLDRPRIPPADVLFTFPLASRRSLVVLREDATYVRSVVEKLGLLSMSTEDMWSALFSSVKSKPKPPPPLWSGPRPRKSGTGKAMDVDQATFVKCMEAIIESKANGGRKRPVKGSSKTAPSKAHETLVNFFQSFDLDQIDRVALNQLMGGLSLLCEGKKSTKLAFSFGLFDSSKPKKKKGAQQPPSLNGDEMFLFLRSFLIVTFSCCKQSMDLSAESVSRYIADTANMVTSDVMRYQWSQRKSDRINFDEFGEWYNEGGFETAPWLELLDLKKWVLVDNMESIHQQRGYGLQHRGLSLSRSDDYDCPPPPPDDAVDASFFTDDHAIMQMDSMDGIDMDLMFLQQQPSQDKENDGVHGNRMLNTFLPSPSPQVPQARRLPPQQNGLKFHLITNEEHGGYMLNVSQRRVSHLQHILLESGLTQVDAEAASRLILNRALAATRGANSRSDVRVAKADFDSALRTLIPNGKSSMNADTQRVFAELLNGLFHAFDSSNSGMAAARQVACGFTVLCRGKKSDKLESAFELMAEAGDGLMTRQELSRFLGSFLAVLLSVAMAPCLDSDENEDTLTLLSNGSRCDHRTLFRAAHAGADWAAAQAFKSRPSNGKSKADTTVTFDNFAEWYTSEGYSNVPWLELLDLGKWVLPPVV